MAPAAQFALMTGSRNPQVLVKLFLVVCSIFSPLAAQAQQPAHISRVVVLGLFPPPKEGIEALRRGLRDFGFEDGRNVSIEIRSADGKPERLNEAAADVARAKADIIVTSGTDATRSAQQATRTIPIVTIVGGDPVAIGFAKSLARPGGNVTGLTSAAAAIALKQLELMRELLPVASRMAVLWRVQNPAHQSTVKALEAAGRSMGIQVVAVSASAGELERAFAAVADVRADGVVMLGDSVFLHERDKILRLAAQTHTPAVYFRADFTERGGLMSFATDTNDLYRRTASYVDKILKGAKAGELPMEEPSRFELVINLKTAQALGITIPKSMLVRADRVIE